MRPRFHLSLALVALFGIVTTRSLMEIDLMNLTEEQKTGPVPVKLHDEVHLKCGEFKPPTRWVRIRELEVTFDKRGSRPYKIPDFTMQDNGNYQCRVETYEYRRCSNVVLCEAAEDLSKCKTEGQTYRHLIKYGPLDLMKETGEDPIRFENLGLLTKTPMIVPMDYDVELDCRKVMGKNMTFLWFVTRKSEWFNLEEYAQFSSKSTKLTPIRRSEYECGVRSILEGTVHIIFNVTFEDKLLAPSYIEMSSMRELDGLLHDNLNISCDTAMNSSMNITWVKSDACPNTETEVYKRIILKTSNHLDARVLQITELSSTDEGCYTCFAKDGNITFFHSQRLRIQRAALRDGLGVFSAKGFQLMVYIPCVVLLLCAVIGGLIFHSRRSKHGLRRRCIPSPQLRPAVDLINRPPSYLELFNEEEVSQSVKICSESEIQSTEKLDHKTHENAEYTPWKLCPDNLKLGDILRESDFYTLYRGQLVKLLSEKSINVVVKMSKAGTKDSDALALVSEMEIMESVGRHVNVICLLGTCTQTDALFFVMEFAKHGNLQDHLRGRGSSLEHEYIHEWKSESERFSIHIDLVSYAHQVAKGMEYLASRRCVHRDLRTKHVLISDGGILKIADYATKRIRRVNFQADTSDNNLLYVRWMAPETLFRGIHTTEANVWSYGILLWEIMTFAETPYPSILTTEELVARLRLGYHMENPNGCPEDIYKLMKRCWNENPGERPRYHQLVEDLRGMLKNLSDQMKRLESNNYQREEYADAARELSRELNYDSEYDDVVPVIGGKIAPA